MSNARTLASTINSSSEIVVPSGGIAFKDLDSSNDSATANESYVLGQDGYEQGSWTPSADVAPSATTIDTITGEYVKIGRVVYVYLSISGTDLVISSYAQYSGLPFTVTATGTGYFSTNAISANIGGEVAIGGTQFYFGSTSSCSRIVATAFYFTNS